MDKHPISRSDSGIFEEHTFGSSTAIFFSVTPCGNMSIFLRSWHLQSRCNNFIEVGFFFLLIIHRGNCPVVNRKSLDFSFWWNVSWHSKFRVIDNISRLREEKFILGFLHISMILGCTFDACPHLVLFLDSFDASGSIWCSGSLY